MKEKSVYIQGLHDRLGKGAISRRRFMEGAIACGLSVSAALTMARSAQASTPKRGGHMVIGMGHGSTTDSTDPATSENGMTNAMNQVMNGRLTGIAPEGGLEPDIAVSWEASDGAAKWVFQLRDGVEFHNGKTLTGDDVVASINYHRGEESKSAAKPIVDPIEDISVDGNNVIFVLKSGNADFPFIMSDYHLAIMPSADGKPDISGVGAGSYKLESFEPGVSAKFVRHKNDYSDQRGFVDSGEILSIIDPNARQNALVSGSIHVADRLDVKTVHLLARNDDVLIDEVTGTQHYTFPMRTDTAPFDNNDVRMALKLALDREQMLQKVLKGHGAVGNDHPISPANRYFNADLPQRSYDPEKAKWHLKQAGLDSLTVDLSASDAAFGGAVDSAILYRETAGKAGITINVVREPGDGYWSNVWNKKPWCACYWGGRPTEDWMFSTAYQTGVPWNDTAWSHERFDKLLLEARAELDEEKRRAMYFEMQEIVANEGGVVVPFYSNYVMGRSKDIAHSGVLAGNWDLDGNKAMERWWFA